jgi:hypothetical protein
MKKADGNKGGDNKEDEITEWLSRRGRTTLDLAAARHLASESPEHWYIALQGARGYIIGKMTMQKYSARHILVDRDGEPMYFLTAEEAKRFLIKELNVPSPQVFSI